MSNTNQFPAPPGFPPIQTGPQLPQIRASTPPPRPRRSNVALYAVLIGGLIALVAAAIYFFPQLPQQVVTEATTDPTKKKIRKYLLENLNNPTWEEVRYWPPRKDTLENRLACRIKIRTPSPLGGGKVLQDLHFWVEKEGVEPVSRRTVEWWISLGKYPFED